MCGKLEQKFECKRKQGKKEERREAVIGNFLGREDTQPTVKSQTEAVRKEGVLDEAEKQEKVMY